jgi:hypothetical protein
MSWRRFIKRKGLERDLPSSQPAGKAPVGGTIDENRYKCIFLNLKVLSSPHRGSHARSLDDGVGVIIHWELNTYK